MSIIATHWQSSVERPTLKLPAEGSAMPWVDSAVSPGVKSRARALRKMADDYGGHAHQLTDLARITLSYTACRRMAKAVRTIKADVMCPMRIRSLRNTFACPTAVGYSDISMVVELSLPDGTRHLAEVHSYAIMRACVRAHTHRTSGTSHLPPPTSHLLRRASCLVPLYLPLTYPKLF